MLKLIISAPRSLGEKIGGKVARYYSVKIDNNGSGNCEIYTHLQGEKKTICSFPSSLDITYIMDLFWLKIKVGDWMR